MRGRWNHEAPEWIQECPADNTTQYVVRQAHEWAIEQLIQEVEQPMLIHPEVAMELAAWWQSAANPAITAFASNGTIMEGLLGEIEHEISAYTFIPDVLGALRAYVGAVMVGD